MTLNSLLTGRHHALAIVVYLIVSLSVPLLLISLSSCSDDPIEQTPPPPEPPAPEPPAPEPPAEPYFSYKVDALTGAIIQRWLIVTNGDGEIVGYKKIEAAGAEGEMTERLAEITHDYINLHTITIYHYPESKYKNIEHYVLGLGLPVGYEWSNHFEPLTPPRQSNTSITVYNRPRPSQMFINTQNIVPPESWYHDESDDVYYESTWSNISYRATEPISLLTVYTGDQAKYTALDNTDGITQTFTYPDDFTDFPITVQASSESEGKPTLLTIGHKDNSQENVFMVAFPQELPPSKEFILPYLPGYLWYSTHFLVNNIYYRSYGSIPDAPIHLAMPDINILNKTYLGFEATYPSDITHINTIFTFEKTLNGDDLRHAIHRAEEPENDIRSDFYYFPQEFIDEHGEVPEFSSFTHFYSHFLKRTGVEGEYPFEEYRYTLSE